MSNADTQIIVTYDNICHVENFEVCANNFTMWKAFNDIARKVECVVAER